MRLRNIPGAEEKLQTYGSFVREPFKNYGKWQQFWGNKNPLHLELGTGKGQFITTLAKENPEINFIGVERAEEVLLTAVKKASQLELANMAFLWVDIKDISQIFAADEVDRLYINFCDPWPKKRHRKRRLTHASFLQEYSKLLKPGGEVHFKTDGEELFEFSLNEFSENGWQLKNICLDLAARGAEGNVTTEYEDKFRQRGMKIYRCEAVNLYK
ncbi:tRNA (guanosine(46)-N7)-methyltransferase TrmB [Bacillota bacterium LX-D]|nr:tRNA (guanosine(46)-N7)-methyltransferase TrmB [Bacillota bacterium LX-D]